MSVSGDVVIIGAGPYGLSIAAHLRARGVGFRIFGSPMSNWQTKMPRGMLLKSDAFASNLSDPETSFTLKDFYAQRGIPYADEGLPVSLENFIAYGQAFQRRFAPDVEERLVVALERSDDGFAVRLDDGEIIEAAKVVVAIGISDFPYLPATLADLPAEFLTHSAQHAELDVFRGREVAVVGSGSSGIDLAALLQEHGASVQLIARQPQLKFHTRTQSGARSLAERIRAPNTGIGPSWRNVFYTKAPGWFNRLPEATRVQIIDNSRFPAGGWYMRDRIIGRVPALEGYTLQAAKIESSRIHLQLTGPDGSQKTVSADHVIAATGYRVDLRLVKFLGDNLCAEIKRVQQAPVLSPHFETSVPGLYVVGPAATYSFGPMFRFVFGAPFAAGRIARHLAVSMARQPVARRTALAAH